jgi:hypothetical protein
MITSPGSILVIEGDGLSGDLMDGSHCFEDGARPRSTRPSSNASWRGLWDGTSTATTTGALVMYDDYAAYLVASELGREMVDVTILEEIVS